SFPRRAVTIKRENIVSALHGDDKTAEILLPPSSATNFCGADEPFFLKCITFAAIVSETEIF
ncbi:MAG: hypothetical protein ACFNJR_06780, partial [Segatella oulorum]|uniref:hypothetical protein n=1 Tax=Segatella oulorum TaxID=28136 RepID=UPI003610EC8A